ncbi:MAG: hypothetical protein EOO90_07655 [Pedobacter sp.]|nr:MAG: hypothetical protein EOO90_07655 [Pedobacter sp.]
MKEKKEKASIKQSKKEAKKALEEKIINALKLVIADFPTKKKKNEKLVNKYAKQLADKLSTEVKISTTENIVVEVPKKVSKKKVTAKTEA